MAWMLKIKRQAGMRYKVFYRDPSGKVITRTFTKLRPRSDSDEKPNPEVHAQAFMAEVEHRKNRGTYRDPASGKITLREFFDQFMKDVPDLRASTRARYEIHGRLYLQSGSLGDMELGSIRFPDVKEFIGKLRKKGVGAPTIESVHRVLHRVLEEAVREGRIESNPSSGVKLPPHTRREPMFLDAQQVRAIAEEVPPRYRALVYFLAYTGLRIGEASALRVKNLDLTRGEVHVVENSPEVAGKRIVGETKNRKRRTVDLAPELVQLLTEHLAEFGTPTDADSLVFTVSRGAAVRQNAFRSMIFQPAAKRAGVTPIPTVHDLRHSAASLMAKVGYTMKQAQEMLGHSHGVMTDRYTHLFPDERKQKAELLGALMRDAEKAGGKIVSLRR